MQFHWVAVVAGKNCFFHEELPSLWNIFVLPTCKFTKRSCSDSQAAKWKTYSGSEDGFLDQLKCHPLSSETAFEFTVWSGLEYKSM